MQTRKKGNAQGIDVSRYQGNIDWKVVKADGISFAFIKASQGQRYVDPTFITNAKGARAAGVLLGAYHFVDATSVEAAKAEARHFAEVLEQIGGAKALDLPAVMDYENNPGNLSKTLISAVALAFLLELERLTGRKPIIYTGNAFAANFNASLGGYKLWIARYSDTRVPSDTATWKRWDIWQYSDSGKIKGIAGNVDLNEFDGTADELRTRFNKKGENTVTEKQRDINKVSPWAADVWEEMTKNGYFDGTRPGAPITREEAAAALSRLRQNILKGDK
ncbi:glycoside hydrolase family 25 protein [Paenibacillus polymyxa]|uniref:glycoside hydrolase family 25 protein n=1 Tax=Paenibacillus polymyxa TaxID=1406 RepID=UPI0009BEAA58|nr:glycoside hydrolase family 25 protein [Paenibacillus polymyxa]